MAIIYTYPTKSTPTLGDLILISDTSAKNLTKNATISSLKDAIDVVDSVIAGSGILVSSATGNVTISTPAYSGQSSIGHVPVGGTSSTFLKGDGTWGAGGSTYLAGDGLDLTGTTFSTDLKANGGLVIQSSELAIDLAASLITGTLNVADGGTSAANAGTLNNALIGNGDAFVESGDVETAMFLPVGSTLRRPAANINNVGLIRYNSQTTNFEVCKETLAASGQYSWYSIDVTIIPA